MESTLSNQIFDIKDKLTDLEFKTLMDTLKLSYEQKEEKAYVLYDITYLKPTLSLNEGCRAVVGFEKCKNIIKLYKKKTSYSNTEFLEDMNNNNGIINIDYKSLKQLQFIKHIEFIAGGNHSCDECDSKYNEEIAEWVSEGADFDIRPEPPTTNTFRIETTTIQIVVIEWKEIK